jgi:hypothetical protein
MIRETLVPGHEMTMNQRKISFGSEEFGIFAPGEKLMLDRSGLFPLIGLRLSI